MSSWLYHAPSLQGESFASWVARLAVGNALAWDRLLEGQGYKPSQGLHELCAEVARHPPTEKRAERPNVRTQASRVKQRIWLSAKR